MQDGQSCLIWASKGGHLDVVKYLYERGRKELLMKMDKVSWDVASDVALGMCVCVVCNIRVPVHVCNFHVCTCIYVYMYTHMYIHVYIYVSTCCVYTHVHISPHTCMYV